MNKMFFQLHTYFNSIDLKYFNQFLETKKELTDLAKGEMYWDILSHSKEENRQYSKLYSLIQEYSYIALIFRHISTEGFINDIGVRYIGNDKFYSEIEGMRYLDKIVNVYEEISKIEFPKSIKLYSNLKDLNSMRNTLIHPKVGEINFEDLFDHSINADKKFASMINSITGNKRKKVNAQKDHTRIVEETKGVYEELSALFFKEISNIKK